MNKSVITWITMAFLTFLSAFCLLYAMGAFSFINPQSSESYSRHQALRMEAVARAPHWRLVAEVSPETLIGREVLQGLRSMVELVNARGGLLGKPLQLEIAVPDDKADAYVQIVHEASRDLSTAAYMGPWRANHVPSSRAISQYYALPTLTTTWSDSLPLLVPDINMSVLLPPQMWADPIGKQLMDKGHRRVLILGPDKQHTGGAYASHFERNLGASGQFEELFRVAYLPPMNPQAVYRSLRLYQENRSFDAIIFTGEADELSALGPVLTELGIRVPIYGSDLFNIVSIQPETLNNFSEGIYYPRIECALVPVEDLEKTQDLVHETPCQWMQFGMLAVYLFVEAVNVQQGYHPEKLTEIMRSLLYKNQSSPQAVIVHLERVYN